MHSYIIRRPPPLSDKTPIVNAELCCTSGDMHSQKGTCNASFVPAALASSTIPSTLHDPVSNIQSTEWNRTTVSKRSDPKVNTRENAAI